MEAVFGHYCLNELQYSPSQLDEVFSAPRNKKAYYYASYGLKLEQIAKDLKKLEGR